jgi:rod shape determining protein RodA
MSYLEYRVTSIPSGFRKILYINWAIVVLIISISTIGFLMLYSVAGGSFTPWAEPQIKRFLIALVMMFVIARVCHRARIASAGWVYG